MKLLFYAIIFAAFFALSKAASNVIVEIEQSEAIKMAEILIKLPLLTRLTGNMKHEIGTMNATAAAAEDGLAKIVGKYLAKLAKCIEEKSQLYTLEKEGGKLVKTFTNECILEFPDYFEQVGNYGLEIVQKLWADVEAYCRIVSNYQIDCLRVAKFFHPPLQKIHDKLREHYPALVEGMGEIEEGIDSSKFASPIVKSPPKSAKTTPESSGETTPSEMPETDVDEEEMLMCKWPREDRKNEMKELKDPSLMCPWPVGQRGHGKRGGTKMVGGSERIPGIWPKRSPLPSPKRENRRKMSKSHLKSPPRVEEGNEEKRGWANVRHRLVKGGKGILEKEFGHHSHEKIPSPPCDLFGKLLPNKGAAEKRRNLFADDGKNWNRRQNGPSEREIVAQQIAAYGKTLKHAMERVNKNEAAQEVTIKGVKALYARAFSMASKLLMRANVQGLQQFFNSAHVDKSKRWTEPNYLRYFIDALMDAWKQRESDFGTFMPFKIDGFLGAPQIDFKVKVPERKKKEGTEGKKKMKKEEEDLKDDDDKRGLKKADLDANNLAIQEVAKEEEEEEEEDEGEEEDEEEPNKQQHDAANTSFPTSDAMPPSI